MAESTNSPPKHSVIERLLSFRIYDQIGCAISAIEGSKLVFDLLHALLQSKEENPELKTENSLVRNVHEYVQTHLNRPISVTDIADHFHVSREHLTRIFAQNGASSPHQYILNCKMSAACSLLHAGILSVKEISTKFGFENVAHFTRAFKRLMHCTPSEYRTIGMLPVNTRLKSE